ncbi:MAG: amidohydrolase [Thiobacillaceae bacterium]|jgi:hypothetical protein|nr:amidohydrolase [Thiobacillaceae bacterium]
MGGLTRRLLLPFALLGGLSSCPAAGMERPLFDAHLHYGAEDARSHSPEQILAILEGNGIVRAVVNGSPADHAMQLHRRAPARVVPFLGVYRTAADKADWHRDATLPDWVERQLETGPWRGVGELHLFAAQRHSPVFRSVVELAARRGLPLQVHADPAVIDALFEHVPQARVIWAHAGAYPYPPLIADYLRRYPNLLVDLSVRDEHIAPAGRLDPEWMLLLMEFPDRFLVGVDTYSAERWRRFGEVAGRIRGWLAQLPPEVAERIAVQNARRLFP